ncbi:gliding motility-associated C-terminal domain-containing protein [bacterium]|nr:gliding motility-associated C-terminal domain-containing protein [bacterium]
MKFRVTFLVFLCMITAATAWSYTYWVPYVDTLHIPGEMSWRSNISLHALYNNTVITSSLIDTTLNAGEGYGEGSFTTCGLSIGATKPLRIIYSTKIVTPSEYEPTEFYYTLQPDIFLDTEYYVGSLYDPPSSWEFVAVTGTQDGTNLDVDGVGSFTINAGECRAFSFPAGSNVMHLTASEKIAVAHISHRQSSHDDFTAYTPLPTSLWGTEYVAPLVHQLWAAGYEDPVDSTSLIIVALENATSVNVAGSVLNLSAGERAKVYIDSDSTTITSNRPIHVMRDYLKYATDRWRSVTRMYSTSVCLHPSDLQVNSAFMDRLNASDMDEHGGPANWWTITCFDNGNRITVDVNFDGSFELDVTLDQFETLYLTDTSMSVIGGWDSASALLQAEYPVQVIRSYRGWWWDYIEAHYEYSNWDFGEIDSSGMPEVNIEHTPPELIPDCIEISPNPFTVDAIITNTGSGDASNVTVTLDLTASGLALMSGDNPQLLGTLEAESGMGLASWEVWIPESLYSSVVCYDIEVTYENPDASDSTITENYCVTIPRLIVLVASITADELEFCEGECTQLHASHVGGMPGEAESYYWFPAEGLSSTDVPDPIACPAETTTYFVEVSEPGGCIDTANITLNVIPTPEITVYGDSICTGETARLTAIVNPRGGEVTYLWEPGGFTEPDIMVNPDRTTDYIVSVVREGCSSAPETVTVYVSPEIIADAGEDTIIPPGDLVTIGGRPTGSGGTDPLTYWWFPPTGLNIQTIPNPIANTAITRTYCVIVTDVVGCADTSCVTVTILDDSTGPEALIVEPLNETYSACEDQRIIVIINDDSGVDTTTVELEVNGVVYTNASPEVSWSGDTLIFTPAPGFWGDEEEVAVRLLRADDIYGNPLQGAPVVWAFIMDFSPPLAWGEFPTPDTIITVSNPMISVFIADSGSGLDWSGIGLEINGEFYPYDTTGMDFDPLTGELRFNTGALGLRFEDGDTVHVCIAGAGDLPDYCAPNVMVDHCWQFYVIISEHNAMMLEPFDGAYSACDDQQIIIIIFSRYEIDTTTIEFYINGILYNIGHPWLSFEEGSLLVFQPPPAYWSDGEMVVVVLTRADDIYGFPLDDTLFSAFAIDLTPPVVTDIAPALETMVSDSGPVIEFDLHDSLSGIDASSITMDINGTIISLPGTGVWEVIHFEFDCAAAGIFFSNGDTVNVCLYGTDSPDYCDANALDTCWLFIVSFSGPVAAVLEPLNGTYTACDDHCIYVLLTDEDGVDTTTVELEVNGIIYNIESPELSMISDTVVFCQSLPWTDAETVDVRLVSASDIYGNEIRNPLEWSFIVDLSPPDYFGFDPAEGEIISDPYHEIMLTIIDSLSGVDDTSIIVFVNDRPYDIFSRAITLTVDTIAGMLYYTLVYNPMDGGFIFRHNDVIRFCIQSYDEPDYCSLHESEFCWEFLVDLVGPAGELDHPFVGAVSSCEDQGAVLRVFDRIISHGVDPSSIRLEVEVAGTTLTSPPVRWEFPEYLYFAPDADIWSNNDSVVIRLLEAEDSLGNGLSRVYSWYYWIDLEPPTLLNPFPPLWGEVGDPTPTITFELTDNLAIVALDSTSITINGDFYPLGHPAFSRVDSVYTFNTELTGTSFSGGDTVEVCLFFMDMPDLCEPNEGDTCWYFTIPVGGPIGHIIEPDSGTYSACNDQRIIIMVQDPDEVLDTTIQLQVNGRIYTVSDPELNYDHDSLIFTPSTLWTDGELVEVCLLEAMDRLYNLLEAAPLCWSFNIDLTPPVVWDVSPVPGSTLITTCPVLSLHLSDSLSGLNEGSIEVEVDSFTFTIMHPFFVWDGESLGIDLCAYGIDLRGGDTVDICLRANDFPDYCGPNILDTCWAFSIAAGGPVASIIEPLPNTYSACDDQGIIVTLVDSNGVVEESIELEVNGVTYNTTDAELTFSAGSLLAFVPSPWFENAETVIVNLLSADDSLGNELGGLLGWTFIMDLSPPVAWDFNPPDLSTVTETSPVISLRIADSLSGLDLSTIELTVDGHPYSIYDPCVTWDGEYFELSTECAGLFWTGGSSIEICAAALDTPGYCPPNTLEVCWEFSFAVGGPDAEIVVPTDNSVSACEDQSILVYLFDSEGIILESIQLQVRDSVYGLNDTTLTYENDTLYFSPPAGFWVDGETVHVALLSASDSLHNPLEDAPIEWIFYVDLSGPVASNFVPADSASIYNWQETIQVELWDNLLGVDSSSIQLQVAGVYRAPGPLTFNLASGCLDWDGTTVTLDPSSVDESDYGIYYTPEEDSLRGTGLYFPEFDTVRVSVYATDNEPDYCSPNPIQEPGSWAFYIPDDDTLCPRFENFEPAYRATGVDFYIFCDIIDSSSVWGDSVFAIYETNTGIFSDTIAMIPTPFTDTSIVNGEVIINFTNSLAIPGFTDTCTVRFEIYAFDDDFDFMNPIDRKQCAAVFYVSIMGRPVAQLVEPLPNTITSCDDQPIIIHLFDHEGIDVNTIELLVEQTTYTIDHEWLTYAAADSLLVFQPESGFFVNEQMVEVVLEGVEDIPGNPMLDTLSWVFGVDLEAPVCSLEYPLNGVMVDDVSPAISIEINDNLAGVRESTISLEVDGVTYQPGQTGIYWMFDTDGINGTLEFDCDEAGIEFVPGDTVFITLEMGDDPDYCDPNWGGCSVWFTILPKMSCYAGPNPFTPNGDGINDNVFFKFPQMLNKKGEIVVLTLRNIEVFRKSFRSINQNSDYLERSWDGRDSKGKPVPEGIYIYVIQVDGKVECNGTIILAR